MALSIKRLKEKWRKFNQARREGKKDVYVFTKEELIELIDRYERHKHRLKPKESQNFARLLYGVLGGLLYLKKSQKMEVLMDRVRMKLEMDSGWKLDKNLVDDRYKK